MFRYIYICVGCVGGSCLCVPIYMFIYVCACACVYTHCLLPLFSVVGKRLLLRLPPEVSSPKSLCGSSLIDTAWYYSIKSARQRDMNREQENYFQLREHQDNKYYRECYFHKDFASLAGEEGHFGAHILASATLWLGGTQGIGGRPVGRFWSRADRWRYSLQAGFLVGASEDPLRLW